MNFAAALREEADRLRRLANEAADARLKADLCVYAHELDARAILMEEAMKSVGGGASSPRASR